MKRMLEFLISWMLALAALCTPIAARAVPQGAAPEPIQVAPGVYMEQGAAGEVDSRNGGRIGNSGFIVGSSGVVVIDTGTSYHHGVALLAHIRRISSKPILLALVTHTRQEFLFGARAFQEQGIPVHMHSQAAGLMRSRCEHCPQTLNQLLGADTMKGTQLFKPDREFESSHTISEAGRPIRILYFGHSAGPGDVAVFDEQTGVLFAGGLLDYQRIPDVQDSDLAGWSQALAALAGLPVQKVVPGHGPVGPASAISDAQRYLVQLQARVLALLHAGTSLLDVGMAATLPDFASWEQYSTIHRRNASVVYLRLEREQMFSQR